MDSRIEGIQCYCLLRLSLLEETLRSEILIMDFPLIRQSRQIFPVLITEQLIQISYLRFRLFT